MADPPLTTLFFNHRWKKADFNAILFDYSRYNAFDANLFDENGQLNKRQNLFPLDEKIYDHSVLDNLERLDQQIDSLNKQRAVLFPLFVHGPPLISEQLTLQLNNLLIPLLNVSNQVIANYYYNEPTSSIKARHRLAAELHSIVRFLQATHNDMHRYRELLLLETAISEEIETTRGYLALHDNLTEQTRMELDEENQDFHDVYLHDRLLTYRDKALNKALHKLQTEREKQKSIIDRAIRDFERQYQKEIQQRTDIIRTLNSYLGDTFLNERIPGQGYEVLPSGRRRNVQLAKYLNALLPLYSSLRKLAIENDIFDTLQRIAKRSLLATHHH